MAGKKAEEEAIVAKYLESKNRPFSVQNIVDALQKEKVKKTAVERSLAALVQKGLVTKKEYGKTKLFLLCQKNIELPDQEEAQAIEQELKSLATEVASVSAEIAECRANEAALRSQLTLNEAMEQCNALEEELQAKESKLTLLGDPSKLPTKEDKVAVEKEYYKVRTAWKKRKRIVKSILDQISEAMQKKPMEVAETIGIETDEEVKVDLANFPEIPDPSKPQRGGMYRPAKRQRMSS